MSTIDMVFEGGGAKGMVFVGALDVLLGGGEHQIGRLLGTSAGAITAVLLAARYTVPEFLDALNEKDANGRPVFEAFMGTPAPFDAAAVRESAIRKFLGNINPPLVPKWLDDKVDEYVASQMAANLRTRNLFSFVERGGWFSADAFTEWMARKLNEGTVDGKQRDFGNMTLAQLYAATGMEVTTVASDTTNERILLLNHRTAPDCPAVYAARMSMSIPLVWQEVIWQKEWGTYQGEDITGTVIVDGGMLSNFPIALFLSSRPEIGDVVGTPKTKNVLGFLIDDKVDVPNLTPRPVGASLLAGAGELRTTRRLLGLLQTMMAAHDNMATTVFAKNVVRLPARGIGTTQFDMTDDERNALVEGGRIAMRNFLANQQVLELAGGEPDFSAPPEALSLADEAAMEILRQ